MPRRRGRLWGAQAPFERNHLMRTQTLAALAAVFVAAVAFLAEANARQLIGLGLVAMGLVCAAAAVSRARYVRETWLGFAVLRTRGGGFVLGSAASVAVVGLFVAALVLT